MGLTFSGYDQWLRWDGSKHILECPEWESPLFKGEPFIHWSQVKIDQVRSGTYLPETAGRIAAARQLEAFQCAADGYWYALDEDGAVSIKITASLAMSISAFKL
jgi:hypothetical protein